MNFSHFVGFLGILLLQALMILQLIRIEGMLVYM
jgi:hypothetical protein